MKMRKQNLFLSKRRGKIFTAILKIQQLYLLAPLTYSRERN
jgi:hypothetical protein